MYAFKNSVYLAIGIAFILSGELLTIRAYDLLGVLLILLGMVMSTLAAYQMGQTSPTSKIR